jgi:hypothetical protein
LARSPQIDTVAEGEGINAALESVWQAKTEYRVELAKKRALRFSTYRKAHSRCPILLKAIFPLEAVAGWESDVGFICPDETAGPTVERQLCSTNYDCVVIGGGVRLPPRNLALLEVVINAVKPIFPKAKLPLRANRLSQRTQHLVPGRISPATTTVSRRRARHRILSVGLWIRNYLAHVVLDSDHSRLGGIAQFETHLPAVW